MTSPATAVLVHGALTDASVWHRVIGQLQSRGIPVLAPSLPMRSFDSDTAYLRSILETVDGPLVVAAHSYAGAVISSPDVLTNQVGALVFVAAFQQDAGETPGGLNGQFPGSLLVPENLVARPYPGGTDIYVRPDRFGAVYAADVDPATVAVMAAAQHPFDPVSLDGAFAATATWRTLPSWAVVATEDRSIPTEALRFMAERAGSTVVEVASAHAVPVAHPGIVADTIAAAVASVA